MKYEVMHLVEGKRIQPVTRLVLLYAGVTGNTNLDEIRQRLLLNRVDTRVARFELQLLGHHPGLGDQITNLAPAKPEIKDGDVIRTTTVEELAPTIDGVPVVDDESLRQSAAVIVDGEDGLVSTRNELRQEVGSLKAITGGGEDDAGGEVRTEESGAAAGHGGEPGRAGGPGDPAGGGSVADPQADHQAGPAVGDGGGADVRVARRKAKGKGHE